MQKKTTYIADDGKEFESEQECIKHEKTEKRAHITAIQTAMCELDDKFWEYFYPNDKEVSTDGRELHIAYMWLQNDIATILSDQQFDGVVAEQYIRKELSNHEYSKEILNYISLDGILEKVVIKRDFKAALDKIKNGRDLATDLGYVLSNQDLKNLALLHKSNKCRKKIEDLLTACNFHYACEKFCHKEYEEFLSV